MSVKAKKKSVKMAPRKKRVAMPDFKKGEGGGDEGLLEKTYLAEGDEPWEDFEDLDGRPKDGFQPHYLSKEMTDSVIAQGLGQRIRNALINAQMDQTELAELVGYTRANVNKVIMGRHNPSLPLLVKLADALKVTVDYLLGRNISGAVLSEQLIEMQRQDYVKSLLISIVVRLLTDSKIEKMILGQRKSATNKSVLEGIECIVNEFRQSKNWGPLEGLVKSPRTVSKEVELEVEDEEEE